MKNLLRNVAHDLAFTLILGAAAAIAALVVFTVIGTVAGGFQLRPGLVTARGGLLVLGSLCLFVCAGMLLRPKTGEKWTQSPAWRRRLQCFGLTRVSAVIGAELIAAASILDYWLYFV